MSHNFKKSLAIGHQGEQAFMLLWPDLKRTDGRTHDFVLPDGSTLELKTDQYDMHSTTNFFIERWSDIHTQKPGGPWQSKATLFAYYFIKNGTAFIFNTAQLVEYLNTQEYRPINIANKSWTTVGYKVSRASLEHLIQKILRA
jgi:hypothetical protein